MIVNSFASKNEKKFLKKIEEIDSSERKDEESGELD